jgi:hypothetical protein
MSRSDERLLEFVRRHVKESGCLLPGFGFRLTNYNSEIKENCMYMYMCVLVGHQREATAFLSNLKIRSATIGEMSSDMNQTLNVRHVKYEHPIYVTEIRTVDDQFIGNYYQLSVERDTEQTVICLLNKAFRNDVTVT